MGFPSQIDDRQKNGSVIPINSSCRENAYDVEAGGYDGSGKSDTVHADKAQLNDLIGTLKSELNSANAVMKIKDEKIVQLNQELNRKITEGTEIAERLKIFEKQQITDNESV